MRRRGFMYKFGGGNSLYTLHHMFVAAWRAYEHASSEEKAMVLAFAGEGTAGVAGDGPEIRVAEASARFPQ